MGVSTPPPGLSWAALVPAIPAIPAAVLALANSSEAPPSAASSEAGPAMQVHLVDVGQGAATLVEFPCGAMLIDAGGEGETEPGYDSVGHLEAYLRAFFDRRADLKDTLDVLVLTHAHIDHVRAVPRVLSAFKVRNVVDDGRDGSVDEATLAVQAARAHAKSTPGSKYLAVRTERFASEKPMGGAAVDPFGNCGGANPSVRLLWGGVATDPGWGTDNYGKRRFDNDNNHSVVVRVDFGESSLLVTGDLEEPGIRSMLAARTLGSTDVDILQVGHHGSYNATTPALLAAVTPEMALISAGRDTRHADWTAWDYGHPRQSTVSLLQQHVSGRRTPLDARVATGVERFTSRRVEEAIYATAWDGDVVVRADLAGRLAVVPPDGAIAAESPNFEGLLTSTPEPLRVRFGDVDEGDAVLLQLGDQELLVDAGRSTDFSRYLEPILAGVTAPLERLVLSHPHIDHYGGVATLLNNVDVTRVLSNGERRGPPRDDKAVASWNELEAEVGKKPGRAIEAAVAGQALVDDGGLLVAVLAAGGEFPDTADGSDINNDSVVLRATFGGRTLLLTGDIEEDGGDALVARYCPHGPGDCPALRSDVLKVPHHGSRHFSTDFLKAVNPRWAVVSAAHERKDSHRLPREEAYNALHDLGAAVYSTSADGPDPVELVIAADGRVAWKVPEKPTFFWAYGDNGWEAVDVGQGGM